MQQQPLNLVLDDFLKSVEKKAFKIAEFAVSDSDEALDLVQNAMIKLVQRYATKKPEEWTLLFYRILQNEIKDWKRKAWVRGWFGRQNDETEHIACDSAHVDPGRNVHQASISEKVHQAIRELPLRQQQVFLLRNWEGLDIKQTAAVMGCTTGTVKTHYSRAIAFLQDKLAGEEL